MVLPVPELELEDNNGVIYPLEWPGRHVMEASGLGMPPIKHWTTRSPYQHGRTHWGYAWQPRIIGLVLYNGSGNRQGMWDGRAANIAMMAPSAGPHKIRMTYPNGEAFDLHDVWYNAGYDLSSAEQGHTWQRGSVQLVVNDPFWKWITAPLDAGETRDAEGRTCIEDDTWTLTGELTLPFTGPYLLGTTVGENTLTCTNDGNEETRPVITVEGPIYDWVISNATNGYILQWDGYQIATGEIVTIDIRDKTCTSSVAGDVSTYLSGDTGSFALDPGANTINVFASGGVVNATTTIGVCWYVEVVGL